MIPIRDLDAKRTGPAIITLLLIAANALMFFFELSLGQRLESFVMSAAFVPARLTQDGLGLGDLGTGLESGLVSMFLHGGWAHFLGNMLFLWIFGDNVEDRLGHFRYLVFYLLCGYAATFAHLWANPGSIVPAIGASGAISGVLGAYLFLHPQARIQTLVFFGFFVRFVYVPAWVFLPIWFLIQLFSGVTSLRVPEAQAGGGVAFFAHIGGFIAGPILLFLLGGGRRPQRREPLAWR
ncbi:MAG TPA: rhomboid family intramembrane serine protease [Thermoanaerobaculia bacterium]|jgi:membrane associated rhomboid family serine protease|nr:rhomboid family intramembrane serine protease [Thermoanaerobaculia bacterium]